MEKHPIRQQILLALLLPLFAGGAVCAVPRQAAAQALDVDGNGTVDVATDIVYIARYLLGLSPVPAGFRAADPSIPSDTVIGSNIAAIRASIDVDDNGVVDVATDIVYIARTLLGLSPVPPSFRSVDPNIPSDALIAATVDLLAGIPTATPTNTLTPTPTATPTSPFIDNGDGTITEGGLMWEKKDQAGGIHDMGNYYVWAGYCTDGSGYCQPDADSASTCSAATGAAPGCTQCSGTATCDTYEYPTIWQWLNQLNGAGFAGHSDWRIPTSAGCCGLPTGQAAELESIVDTSVAGCGSGSACVPPAFNNNCTPGCTVTNCSCTVSGSYWSSSTVAAFPFEAWSVGFFYGGVNNDNKSGGYDVRAVRGGS